MLYHCIGAIFGLRIDVRECDNDLPAIGPLTTLRLTERLAGQLGTLADLKLGIYEHLTVYNFL